MQQHSFPHNSIRESQDRSWTLKLVDALPKVQRGELPEIILTLQVLDDYRMLSPLTTLMENPEESNHVRSAASAILSRATTADTATTRRIWWGSGDDILMRHAIYVAERSEADLIEQVASDPSHPFFQAAIESMSFGFEEPRFQHLKVQALSHPEAEVRRTAAAAVLWDQPAAAEPVLLSLAQDENEEVVQEALDTLAYYDSKTTLLALSELSNTGRTDRQQRYADVFEYLRTDFTTSYQHLHDKHPKAASVFKSWLGDAWDVLNIPAESGRQGDSSTVATNVNSEHGNAAPTLMEISNRFDDADGKWADRWTFMTSFNWTAVEQDERLRLIEYFSSHPDWAVREASCRALSHLGATEVLLQFLEDPVFVVRKMAAYYIREVPRDTRAASKLWSMLAEGSISGTHAREALESFSAHSSDVDLDSKLTELAETDQRESVVSSAVWLLSQRERTQNVQMLIPLLFREPLVTWGVHQAILCACEKLNIPVPDLKALTEIDDLHVQEALAILQASRSI